MAVQDAEGSVEWRLEMWEWAMNPSKGYIKDYVWGDGFKISQYEQKLARTATGFGLVQQGSNTLYAKTGSWHSFLIVTIQAFGYVGLGITLIWVLYVACIAMRVCIAVKSFRGREFIYIVLLQFMCYTTIIPIAASDTKALFRQFSTAATLKLLYISLRESGHITSIFKRNTYIPNMIKYDSDNGVRLNSLKA